MKSFFVLIMSLLTPGLGQISMGSKKSGFGILTLFLFASLADENLSVSKNMYFAFKGLVWLIFLVALAILAWDYFKNKKVLFSNEVSFGKLFIIFLFYIPVCFVISKFPVFKVYANPAASMSPLIKAGDFVSFKHYYFNKKLPERGTVIIFKSPKDGVVFVKRLIGLPGDEIKITDNQITLNGSEILRNQIDFDFKGEKNLYLDQMSEDKNPLIFKETLGSVSYNVMILEGMSSMDQETYKVPEGHFYVLGDNRSNSMDSRYMKSIPIENILGEFRFVLD